MPKTTFTELAVSRLCFPPKPRQLDYFETLKKGLSLVLRVSYGGAKTWRVMHYSVGRARTEKIGIYPDLNVRDAREIAFRFDPTLAEAKRRAGTFEEVSASWVRLYVQENGLRSQREIERQLSRYILPRWQRTPFIQVGRTQVSHLLDEIAFNHGRAQADAVLATIRSITNWYQSRNEGYVSPIVAKMRRNKPKPRTRILSDDELCKLWNAEGIFGSILKCCLLTAQRREKIASMRWHDICDGAWTVPMQEREKGTGGRLILPRSILEIIEAQLRIDNNPYVFSSGRQKHFNSWSQRKAELDEQIKFESNWTIHDLRRTARSLMSRADVRPEIAERVLGHAISGVQGVYDRHGYEMQKADALQRLAHLIDSIVNAPTGNVVLIAKRQYA